MDDHEPAPLTRELPATLWRERCPLATPRYVERFRGERSNTAWSVHDFFEFTAVLAGSGEIEFTGQRLALAADTLVLVPPGTAHRESGEAGLETVWIGLDADLHGLREIRRPRAVADAGLARRTLRLWKLAATRPPGAGLELDGILLEIIGGWLRGLRRQPAAGAETLSGIIEHLHEHYAREIDISTLARRLGWSDSYFFRRFRLRTGATPVEYLNSIRVRQAMLHLTHGALPLRAIAPLCGFRDPAYLSRVFKKHTGMSPQAYRRRPPDSAKGEAV